MPLNRLTQPSGLVILGKPQGSSGQKGEGTCRLEGQHLALSLQGRSLQGQKLRDPGPDSRGGPGHACSEAHIAQPGKTEAQRGRASLLCLHICFILDQIQPPKTGPGLGAGAALGSGVGRKTGPGWVPT